MLFSNKKVSNHRHKSVFKDFFKYMDLNLKKRVIPGKSKKVLLIFASLYFWISLSAKKLPLYDFDVIKKGKTAKIVVNETSFSAHFSGLEVLTYKNPKYLAFSKPFVHFLKQKIEKNHFMISQENTEIIITINIPFYEIEEMNVRQKAYLLKLFKANKIDPKRFYSFSISFLLSDFLKPYLENPNKRQDLIFKHIMNLFLKNPYFFSILQDTKYRLLLFDKKSNNPLATFIDLIEKKKNVTGINKKYNELNKWIDGIIPPND